MDAACPISNPVAQAVWKTEGLQPERAEEEEVSIGKSQFCRLRCKGSEQRKEGAYGRFCE